MRKCLAIAITQFRITLKSKSCLATMFGMPPSLMIIFGLLLGGGSAGDTPSVPKGAVYPLAIIDQDQSPAARLLTEALQAEPNLSVRTAERSELGKLLAGAKVIAGA